MTRYVFNVTSDLVSAEALDLTDDAAAIDAGKAKLAKLIVASNISQRLIIQRERGEIVARMRQEPGQPASVLENE